MCLYSSFLGLPDPRFAGLSPKPQYAPSRNFKTVHVKIELDLDIPKKTVSGICTTSFKSLNGKSSLILKAHHFKLLYVKDGKGKPLKHTYDDSEIEITTDAETDKEIRTSRFRSGHTARAKMRRTGFLRRISRTTNPPPRC